MTTSSILTDILCHSEAESLIAELRAEADAVMPRLASNPRAVREMNKLDSVIRESMRLNPLMGRGLQREVVQPGGISTPGGQFLPQGTHICAPLSSRARDAEVWERPDEFVPLRFYKSPEDLKANEEDKQWSAVHVTESFLSFGLGRHAW